MQTEVHGWCRYAAQTRGLAASSSDRMTGHIVLAAGWRLLLYLADQYLGFEDGRCL